MDFKSSSNTKLIATVVVLLFTVYMFWNVFAIIGILYVVSLVNGEKLKQLKEKLITPEMANKLSKVFGTPTSNTDPPKSTSGLTGELPFVNPTSAATQPISVF